MNALIDLTGNVFGRLTVLRPSRNAKTMRHVWLCQCECGNEHESIGSSLRSGKTRSCGCLQKEDTVRRLTKHGKLNSSEYTSWRGMKDRCSQPGHPQWKWYGGRGITVCENWKQSFQNFFEDMGPKPDRSYTIERIDNGKNYEPGNCKWATREEQRHNTRLTWRKEDDDFLRKCVASGMDMKEISKMSGRKYHCITSRIYRLGLKSGKPRAPVAVVSSWVF